MLQAVLFIALITLGFRLIWLHDTSRTPFWHSKVWVAAGLCAVVAGVFGVTFTLGAIYGGVL